MDAPIAHQPVLPREVGQLLAVRREDVVVDATVGLGGHARLLAESLGPEGRLIGLDVDPGHLRAAASRLSGLACRVDLIQGNFAELSDVLASVGVEAVDVLFADLGVSSDQLNDPARGFSFQHDGPLDMRLDPRLVTTAADLVNRLSERELGDVLFHNAQETAGRRIGRRICEVRRDRRITTTRQLAAIVAGALGMEEDSRATRIHPATRTFLALRMEVNREIPCLEALLSAAPRHLRANGRFGVIAFHSVEDKVVKTDFRRRKNEGVYRLKTNKPVVASDAERAENPRSRSAKLRVAEKV